MKHRTALFLGVCLLLVSGFTLADADQFTDPIPPEVLVVDAQYNDGEEYTDCILIEGTPGGDFCYLLSPWRVYGYRKADDAWEMWAQVSPMEQQAGTQTYFRRHTAGAAPGIQGECGLSYADGYGFDLIKAYTDDPDSVVMLLQYHWNGERFGLVGWQSGSTGQFAVWEDGLWVFYSSATGESLGSVRIDMLAQYGLLVGEEDVPLTLADARKLEAVTQATAETLFPGWTLQSYQAYNMGRDPDVGYYRIEDGLLAIRRVSLSSEAGGVTRQTDTVSIPLSEALLARLQTEDVSELLDASGCGDTFLTDAAFDTAQIPITDTVLQSDLQSGGLLLLTEDANGVRRLHWVTPDGDGYAVRTSQPLPEDAYLDLFHCGDGEFCLEWDAQYSQCSAYYTADGTWALGWNTRDGMDSFMYGTVFCGIQQSSAFNGADSILVGSYPWSDLFSLDVTQLPASTGEAAAQLTREGWAVVSNPDPKDRLHLRAEPNTSSESLGKFYNRTPVRVLETRDGWARVRVGTDGRLEGWMMTKYLAFGTAMDAVASASPDLILREGYENNPLFAAPDRKETTGVYFGYGTWIAGVIGDEWYILLDTDGNTGYLPQSWFFAGNG